MVGLELKRICISAHVKRIKARVEMDLRKLWGLKEENGRKLQSDLPTLLFPCIVSKINGIVLLEILFPQLGLDPPYLYSYQAGLTTL